MKTAIQRLRVHVSRISYGHPEYKRLNFISRHEEDAVQDLFDWIGEHYSLDEYLADSKHEEALELRTDRKSYWNEEIVSPEEIVDLHWLLFFKSCPMTRIHAAFDLMRQMRPEIIPSKIAHARFRTGSKRFLNYAEWMKEHGLEIPEESIDPEETTELIVSRLKRCKFNPTTAPKGTGLLYGDETSNHETPHFRGVIKAPDQTLYWAKAWLRENQNGDRLLLELKLQPKQ